MHAGFGRKHCGGTPCLRMYDYALREGVSFVDTIYEKRLGGTTGYNLFRIRSVHISTVSIVLRNFVRRFREMRHSVSVQH